MPASGIAVVNASVVAALAATVSAGAWRAMLRTGNSRITLVAAGFAVLAAKSVAKATYLLGPGVVPPGAEVAFGLADVSMVGLVAWPILFPRRIAKE